MLLSNNTLLLVKACFTKPAVTVITMRIIITIKMKSGYALKKLKVAIYCLPHLLLGEKNTPYMFL